MNNRILAICDLEAEYAFKLADYFEQKKELPFEVQVFSNTEDLLLFSKNHPLETILISESAYCREISSMQETKIIILNESGSVLYSDYENLDKYQSSENILREVMCYYTKEEISSVPKLMTDKVTKLIGIYSPVKKCLQTSFALTLGQMATKNNRVLYLNFESFSGFERILGKQFKAELTDLLYFIKHAKGKLLYRVESMIEKVGNLDIVPPIFSVVDLQTVSAEDWKELLCQLCERCCYDYIILDLSDGMRGLFEILRMCEEIHTIYAKDDFSVAKLEQYESLLKVSEYEDVLQKTKKWEFPQFKSLPGQVEQLLFSELGDYIKKVIGKEAYGGI